MERTEPLLRVVVECHNNVHASLHPSGWTSSKTFTMVSLSQISACCQAAFEVFSLLCWPSQLLERSHLLPVELSKWTHWSKHFVLSPHCLLLSCAVRLTCSCNTPHRTQKLNFSLLYSQKPRGTSSSERLRINTFIMRCIPVTLIKG